MATLIGGPLAGAILLRENYLSLSNKKNARRALIMGVILFFVFDLFLMPNNTLMSLIVRVTNNTSPVVGIYKLIYFGAAFFCYNALQADVLLKHEKAKKEFYPSQDGFTIGVVICGMQILILYLLGKIIYA